MRVCLVCVCVCVCVCVRARKGISFLEYITQDRIKTVIMMMMMFIQQISPTSAQVIGCCCIPGLWAVVNNAGVGGSVLGPLEWHRRDAYRELLDVNLLGMVDVTRIFLPLIRKGQGRIVNMSSLAGRMAAIGNGLYTVSKYAVEGYSDCLRYASTLAQSYK